MGGQLLVGADGRVGGYAFYLCGRRYVYWLVADRMGPVQGAMADDALPPAEEPSTEPAVKKKVQVEFVRIDKSRYGLFWSLRGYTGV